MILTWTLECEFLGPMWLLGSAVNIWMFCHAMHIHSKWCGDGIVGLVTRLRAAHPRIRDSIRGTDNRSLLLRNVRAGCRPHPAAHSVDTGALLTWVKLLGCQADHTFCAEVKNVELHNHYPIHLRGLHRDFTFF